MYSIVHTWLRRGGLAGGLHARKDAFGLANVNLYYLPHYFATRKVGVRIGNSILIAH